MSRSSDPLSRLNRPRDRQRQMPRRQKWRRSPLVLFLLLLVWSVCLGWGLAQATEVAKQDGLRSLAGIAQVSQPSQPASSGTVDVIPERHQLGQEFYLENCATCHLAIPPAVMPSETWRQLLQDSQHYGQQLRPLVDPGRLLVWNYLSTFSRPELDKEEIPYRISESRYFKALHPKVKLPRPLSISSCVSCHPGAEKYNFRSLTPEWQNAP